MALATLGYRVVDCNRELANKHNQEVDEAYENGYRPAAGVRKKKKKKTIQAVSRNTKVAKIGGEDGIVNPAAYKLYSAYWTSNRRVYPVMILGWDKQDQCGFPGTKLADTGLLKPSAEPPDCYVYSEGKIVNWAPGFEDGGAKVKARAFPVRWFDKDQAWSWGWVEARHLREFPTSFPKGKHGKLFVRARSWYQRIQKSGEGQDGESKPTITAAGT